MFYFHHRFEVVVTPRRKLVSFVNDNIVVLIINNKKIENETIKCIKLFLNLRNEMFLKILQSNSTSLQSLFRFRGKLIMKITSKGTSCCWQKSVEKVC